MFPILILIGACAMLNAHSLEDDKLIWAPPYVQSRASFSRARLYLQERVPHENRNITNPSARAHFGNGIIVGVLGALVDAYEHKTDKKPFLPLSVLQEAVPKVWEQYNALAADPLNRLLADAQLKTNPISALIDALCTNTNSVYECNREVDKKVYGNQYLLSRARLLLQLGSLSDTYLNRVPVLDELARNRREIPYLIQNVDTPTTIDIVEDLAKAHNLLNRASNVL